MSDLKDGYKTTEFWAMVINMVLNVAVSFGVVNAGDAENLAAVIVPLVVAAVGLVAYIAGRSYVKSKARY